VVVGQAAIVKESGAETRRRAPFGQEISEVLGLKPELARISSVMTDRIGRSRELLAVDEARRALAP
jgi:hypothetical protein